MTVPPAVLPGSPKPSPEPAVARVPVPRGDELHGPSTAETGRPRIANPVPEASAGGASPRSGWVEAAAAMREGDYPRAERAFDVLARSNAPRTRDEARLARAQVWIAEGRSDEARAELEALARSGATALVRERASDSLRNVH